MNNEKTFVGIDLGKKKLDAVRLTSENKKLERMVFDTDNSGIEQLANWLKESDLIAMEAGNNAFRIAKQLYNRIDKKRIVVLNPGDLAVIYRSLKKTDKEDSLKIARLIQRIPVEELPTVDIPTDEEEDARRLASEEEFWKGQCTKSKNRLHNLLSQEGVVSIKKSELEKKSIREQLVNKLSKRHIKEGKRLIRSIEEAENCLEEIEKEIKETLKKKSGYTELVMSMPGVGLITTLILLAYVGDGKRFSSHSQMSYYAGLVPRVDMSGDTVHYGRIVKRGCHALRRVMIQGAWSLTRSTHGGELKLFYEKLKSKKGSGKAVVALARKMVEVIHAMLTNGESFRYSTEEFTNRKLKIYGLI